MSGPAGYRLGIDVGGTFTDFVLHDPATDSKGSYPVRAGTS